MTVEDSKRTTSEIQQVTDGDEPPASVDGIERTIGHDEFDPIGTLVLIGIYFIVLVLLWLFTYFVEFLGNDPTVIGTIVAALGVGGVL